MTPRPILLQTLDASALTRLAEAHDDAGMLTVIAARGEQSATEIRTVLNRHRRDLAVDGLVEDAVALADGRQHGPAHALVAALSSGTADCYSLPAPAATHVAIGPRVDVVPLARAFDDARRVGVVDVRNEGMRILECAEGGESVEEIEFAIEGDWAELRGPSRRNPLRAYESSSQRDLYERRRDAERARELTSADDELVLLARRRGWAAVIVAGDPALAKIVADALHAVVRIDRRLAPWESPGALARELRGELAMARRAALRGVADEARARPGGFARGPHDVIAAVATGRAHAVLVDERQLGDALDDVVRPALAAGLAVHFADGELGDLQGAICALSGTAER